MFRAVTVLCGDEHGFIIQRQKNPEIFKGLMNLPGGKRESLESWEVCAARELKEETGIKIDYKQLVPCALIKKPSHDILIPMYRFPIGLHPGPIETPEGEKELLTIATFYEAMRMQLVPNLYFLLPLVFRSRLLKDKFPIFDSDNNIISLVSHSELVRQIGD